MIINEKQKAREKGRKLFLPTPFFCANVRFHLVDESIRGWKTDQKKCFQGSLLGISSCLANQGGWYNSISSRWPPIKGDEWEPFNGPSVNLHPRLSSPLFNPFHHHPWNKEHSSPLPRHLLSLTRVNDAPTLPPPPRWNLSLNSVIFLAASPLNPRATSRVSRDSATRLCYSSTRENKEPPLEDFKERIYRVLGLLFAPEIVFHALFFFSLVQVSMCCFEREDIEFLPRDSFSNRKFDLNLGFEIFVFPLNGKRAGRLV